MSKVRDFMSGLTHCIGASLSLVGLVILIIYAAINGDAFDVVSFTLFGTGLLLFYLFSTLYHWLNIKEKSLNIFKKFNHITIYLLIATTFTPICLGPLRGPWGWSIFGVIWGFTVLGITFSAIWTKIPRAITLILSLLIGLLILITIVPLIHTYRQMNLLYSLWWLFVGFIFHTISGIFYALKMPKKHFKLFSCHEFSHILIMFGSFFQYWFILNYVTMF